MAAWLLGHSDRFAAVVARRPIVDFTLLAERAAPFLGALPWDDPDAYAKHSPIYFAQNWKTPTLVLASDVDAQSDEFYHAAAIAEDQLRDGADSRLEQTVGASRRTGDYTRLVEVRAAVGRPKPC